MKILLYKGKSIISKMIKFQTRSKYSHVAVMLEDGSAYEAWQKGGVRHIDSPFDGHKPGTEIDVYAIYGKYDEPTVVEFLQQQLGAKYDYASVLRFVSRRHAGDNNKFFCSELALMAFIEGGLSLLNADPSEMSPRDVSISPLLVFEKTIGEA